MYVYILITKILIEITDFFYNNIFLLFFFLLNFLFIYFLKYNIDFKNNILKNSSIENKKKNTRSVANATKTIFLFKKKIEPRVLNYLKNL